MAFTSIAKLETTALMAQARETTFKKLADQGYNSGHATQDKTRESGDAGVVQQLAIHTAGGIVTEAQTPMIIAPKGAQVTTEATLENKDVGFVNVGNVAEIKLQTFPYTRCRAVQAGVERVTVDTVNDEKRSAIFPLMLAPKTKQIDVHGKMIQLTPGMNQIAENETGQRRVIEYLLGPIQRAGKVLRER